MFTCAHAWIIHPAFADLLPIPRWCSTPVVPSIAIAWHPPSDYFVRFIFKQLRVSAFILYELFTAWGNSSEFVINHSSVINHTFVTTWRFTSIHQRSDFADVTYDGHANSILVSHVTGDVIRWYASFTIWINDVSTIYRCRVKLLKVTARLC